MAYAMAFDGQLLARHTEDVTVWTLVEDPKDAMTVDSKERAWRVIGRLKDTFSPGNHPTCRALPDQEDMYEFFQLATPLEI